MYVYIYIYNIYIYIYIYIYLMEMYYSVFNTDTGTNPHFVGTGLGEGRPNAKIFLSDFRKLLKMN